MVSLQDARVDTCGSKAATCSKLAQLGAKASSEFKAVPGCALAFGSMEATLKLSNLSDEHVRLRDLTHTCSDTELPRVCAELRAVVRKASEQLPAEAIGEIQKAFQPVAIIVARSSANVEDLAGMSAAGLYESVLGIHVGVA